MHQNEGFHRHLKRQRLVTTATTITRPHTTFALTATIRLPGAPVTTTDATSTSSASLAVRPTSNTSVVVTTTASAVTTTRALVTPTTPTVPPVHTTPRAIVTTRSSSGSNIVTITKTEASKQTGSSNSANDSSVTSATQNTGTIIGIVAGVVAGIIVLAVIVAFVVRKMRARKRSHEEFSASHFRKSAVILDEKDSLSPRPPSMIERRAATAGIPPPPSPAYGFNDGASQLSADPHYAPQFDRQFEREGGLYGAPSAYGAAAGPQAPPSPYRGPQGAPVYGAPNPQGAPPIPYSGQNMYNQFPERNFGGGYGTGAGVGVFGGPAPYAPYAQNSRPQQSGYSQYGGQQQQYHNFTPGLAANHSAPGTPTRSNSHGRAPNPFSDNVPAPASPVISHDSNSSPTPSLSALPSRTPTPPQKPEAYLTRQSEEAAPPAYSDNGLYANLERDAKAPIVMSVEGTSSAVVPSASSSRAAPAPASPAAPGSAVDNINKARPVSSYTVYDPDDAYGGM